MIKCPQTIRMRRGQNIGSAETVRHLNRPLCVQECFVWVLQGDLWDEGAKGRIQSLFPDSQHVEQLIRRVRQLGHAYWSEGNRICVDLVTMQGKMGTHPDTWFRACGVVLSNPIDMTLRVCARAASINFQEAQDIAVIWASIIASLTQCAVQVGGVTCHATEVYARMMQRDAPCSFLANRVRETEALTTCCRENVTCVSGVKNSLLEEIRTNLEPRLQELCQDWEESAKWVGAYVHSFAHFPHAHDVSVMRGRMRGGCFWPHFVRRHRDASHKDNSYDIGDDDAYHGGNNHGRECVRVCPDWGLLLRGEEGSMICEGAALVPS